MFAFSFLISALAGILFGIAPARQASRLDPSTALKGGGDAPTPGAGRWTLRDLLVAVQVAVCVVLVLACLISIRALHYATAMPLGFQTHGIMVLGVELALAGYDQNRGELAQQRLLAGMSHIPGVQAAAFANSIPLSLDQSSSRASREGAVDDSEHVSGVIYYQVSPGFLQTMGIRLLAGRDFASWDDRQHPQAAIVNETFLRRVLQIQQPSASIGRRFQGGGQLRTIIGVVEDGKYVSLTEAARPAMLLPMAQSYNSTTVLLVRSALPPAQIIREMRDVVGTLEPQLASYGAGTVESMLGLALFPNRAAVVALSAFGVLALALALTGLYGVVASAVSSRQREIGIRLAVGARRVDILRQILGRMVMMLLCGSAAGLVLAFVGRRLLANVVHLAAPQDPLMPVGVLAVMLAVGAVASYLPTRRALRIDPARALRGD